MVCDRALEASFPYVRAKPEIHVFKHANQSESKERLLLFTVKALLDKETKAMIKL